ncbi:(Fe-S)-binding protein [Candidatus Woesearchaeota archaeon]|nr:(Fe-S)-binding protein [Candidatus Woesearchaeota archaeon]
MPEKVSVIKCSSYNKEEVYNSVKQSLDNIGFRFKENSTVLLKPNILSSTTPDKAVTTHPSIVEAVCKLLKEKNCKVIIAESSGFSGTTKKAFEVSGIKEAADRYNAELINLGSSALRKIENKEGVVLKELYLPEILFKVDMIINLPKLKTHSLMLYTGAVKNLFGFIPGGRKQKYHLVGSTKEKLAKLLVDIYQLAKPNLTIMDGVIGLEGNGPGVSGIPIKTGIIMVSESCPALDIIASGIIGYNPFEIPTNKECIERDLVDKESIQVIGEFVKVNYKKPSPQISKIPKFLSNLAFKHSISYPKINKELCRKCSICINSCPAKALQMKGYPVLDKSKCINCYCCHELCPHKAITLKKSAVISLLIKIKDALKL